MYRFISSLVSSLYRLFVHTMATFTEVLSKHHRKVSHRVSAPPPARKSGTPTCRHCENLHLPSNHSLRNKEGILMCPVLLNTECRYCHELGHTLSNCEKRNKANQSRDRVRNPSVGNPSVGNVTPSSADTTHSWMISSDSESDSDPPTPKLSLIHPDDCVVMEDVLRVYSPIQFRCLEKYPEGTPWEDFDSDTEH
jgi:hypothetical protein